MTTQGTTKIIFGTGANLIVESGMFDILKKTVHFYTCKFYMVSSVFYDCLVNVLCSLTLKHGMEHNIQLHNTTETTTKYINKRKKC